MFQRYGITIEADQRDALAKVEAFVQRDHTATVVPITKQKTG